LLILGIYFKDTVLKDTIYLKNLTCIYLELCKEEVEK